MSDDQPSAPRTRTSQRLRNLVIVLAGIIIGQAILYGPSLVGRKILLPLDLLARQNVYLPQTPETRQIVPHDPVLADLIEAEEISRRFTVSELHAGRWPVWAPYQYAGGPFVWPKYSPLLLFKFCTASPVILAWAQLLAAMVAGLVAYVFFRRVLGVSFWPAAVVAWCYPLTGFFVFWEGYLLGTVVSWLPWLFLAVDNTVRRPRSLAAMGLGVVTGLVLTSGPLDIAGQVLLASGLFAVWGLLDAYRRQWFQAPARRAVLLLALGWTLGFMLAAPHLLPLLEYARTGARVERRSAGAEERPPVGLAALPQVVLPNLYGSTQRGSFPIFPNGQGNLLESSAATYAGVIATLFAAPLAWCSRRHRSINLFWACLGLFALSWCLNVPGLVALLRLPGLNLMSHNRFVFAASFAILAMAAVGLETLAQGGVQPRRWHWLPAALLAGLCAWCCYRVVFPPEPLATGIVQAVLQGKSFGWVHDLAGVEQVQAWFVRTNLMAALLCGLGGVGWLIVWSGQPWRPWAVPALGIILVADLLWFAHDRSAQCDPALYYPRIPVLEEIAKATPGRIVGYNCLPATLPQTHGLRDVRGYDAVDPARLMPLMALAAETNSPTLSYAQTQWYIPRSQFAPPDGIRLSPILDLLGVRYVIFRGTPPPEIHAAFQSPDYWALVNKTALARAFVPQRVETVADDRERLRQLASPQFDPRAVAYVESPVSLPATCRGEAAIVSEIPTRVTLSVKMETPGLVVLADLWDKGWQAYLGGAPVPILRANHALRGVVLPAGAATLEFRYEPASLTWGLRLAGLAAATLSLLAGVSWRRRRWPLPAGALFVAFVLSVPSARAEDWPRFLGPRADNTSTETNLLECWPTTGPPILWEKPIGTGYSAPSVRGDWLVLHHRLGNEEIVEAMEPRSGKTNWTYKNSSRFTDPFGYNNGPRCTPMLTSNRCYTFGAEGRLLCLDLADGRVVWQRDTAQEWNVPQAFFGVGSTPLLEDGKLIVMIGGQPDAGVVALELESGKTIWESVGKKTWSGVTPIGWRTTKPYEWTGREMLASYASPVGATIHGRRHLFCLMRQGLVSLNPTNGVVNFKRWSQCPVNESVNAMTPVVQDDLVFISAAYYRVGSVLLRVNPDGKSFEEVWRNPQSPFARDPATGGYETPVLEMHWARPVLLNGFLYAFSGRNEPDASFRCVELKTGKLRWTRDEAWPAHSSRQPHVFGRGSAILADGKLLALGEGGRLGLFQPNPQRCEEISAWQVPVLRYPCWAAPVLAEKRLFLRSEDRLVCVDLAKR